MIKLQHFFTIQSRADFDARPINIHVLWVEEGTMAAEARTGDVS
jgi:hypothetical protein